MSDYATKQGQYQGVERMTDTHPSELREGSVLSMLVEIDKAATRLDHLLSTLRSNLGPVLAPDVPSERVAASPSTSCDYAEKLGSHLRNLFTMSERVEDLNDRLRL